MASVIHRFNEQIVKFYNELACVAVHFYAQDHVIELTPKFSEKLNMVYPQTLSKNFVSKMNHWS